jgi:hypothetical protein
VGALGSLKKKRKIVTGKLKRSNERPNKSVTPLLSRREAVQSSLSSPCLSPMPSEYLNRFGNPALVISLNSGR